MSVTAQDFYFNVALERKGDQNYQELELELELELENA